MCSVPDSDITILSQYSKVPSLTSETYENLAKALQLQYNLPSLSNFNSALKLYFCLVQLIDQVVEQI